MRKNPLWSGKAFSGVTIGGSGGGQPLPLVILTVVVLAMALITVFSPRGAADDETDPYKCEHCGHIEHSAPQALQATSPGISPSPLECPQCNNNTLRPALKCPGCNEVFIPKGTSLADMDYTCPNCGQDYRALLQEQYQR